MTVSVSIVGATGAVGKEMITCLYKERFPLSSVRLFASSRSAGADLDTPFGPLVVEEFKVDTVSESKIVLLAVSGEFSKQYAFSLVDRGCVVIDNSSAFRYESNIPLIVPELNGTEIDIRKCRSGCLIANPNCSTAILAMVLFPIYKKFGVRKVICSTYQAASGAGEAGMQELELAMRAHVNNEKFNQDVFSHNLCGNVIPCIDTVLENDYTKEEMKMVWELGKIFSNQDMKISCTAVRVPTVRAHCIAATVELDRLPDSIDGLRELLSEAPGVEVVDDPRNKQYPVPETASENANVQVGRIRRNLVFENGIDLFVCGDQLLRGAALNAVRIARLVL